MENRTTGSTHRPSDPWRPDGWLAVAIGVASLVSVAYVTTHGHPAYEGGLYLQIVEEVLENGYRLPEAIPHYTAGGVPFAYPPLMFYVVAAVVDLTGADPVWLMRVVPGAVTVLYLVPFYAVARELLASARRAGFATLLFAVTPPVLQWHISAGGLVRAPALLFTLTGIYTGVKLFRTGDRGWLVPSTVLWGLTVLTHPVYTVFFGWSYLLLYPTVDRSRTGLLHGAAVCLGGLLLAAPWWLQVVAAQGPGIFFGATHTRTTLGGGGWRLLTQFVYPITSVDAVTPFYLGAYVGGAYALFRRRYFLPAWMASAAYLLGTPRFTFVAGSMLAAILLFEVVVPLASAVDGGGAPIGRREVTLALVVLLATGAAGVGVAYSTSALDTAHGDSSSQPQTVHRTDLEAMAWAEEHTRSGADFLVLGDAAEWFPYYAERTILVSPWGTEWTTPETFHEQVELYSDISTCRATSCLDAAYADVGQTPDYVYVPARTYTVRGDSHERPDYLITALRASDRYRLRFANRGVLVFEVDDRVGSASTGGHSPGGETP